MRQVQDRRAGMLATAATAVLFGVAAAPGAFAQGTAGQPQQTTRAQGTVTQGADLQGAENALRQAHGQLGSTGTAQPGAVQGARQALDRMQQALGTVPADRRSGEDYRNLEREIGEARQALAGDRVDAARARSAIDEVLQAAPAVRTAGGAAGSGGQVVVQQPAATLQLTQPPPQVRVEQPQPEITVVVPQPEIIVRQPPPQVTVRMPEPQVAVQQGQPQVQVQQAQPTVRVQPAEGQPTIRYEQTGEPVIRTERQAQPLAGDAQTGASAQPAQPAQSGGAQQAAGMSLARVSNLVGSNVVGANGRDAGEVQNLLIDQQGQVRAAVVEWGGFLGIGSRQAVVPIEQLRFGAEGERVRMDLTREQLERLPRYDSGRVTEYGREQGWGEGVRLHR